jgi:pyruvate dehydrogenase E2 component (dihydrolipoamide acetyltransferase)
MTETSIVMPKLGLTMSEGLLAEWSVKPGDEVVAGQVLFVVETDKISNEIEAPAAGRIIQVLVGEGETVEVGTPVALWTGPGPASRPASSEPELSAAARSEVANGVRIRSTPLARRLARQGDIALASCVGSGPRGRIQACDVRAALEQRAARPAPAKGALDLRAIIAARVSRSKAEIPHFYVTADAAFDALDALRRDLNADPSSPTKLSVTAFLAAAVARALRLVPEANVVWRDGRAKPLGGVGVGMAVDTPVGVMAPVIQIAPSDSLHALAGKLEAAIRRARDRRLGAADAGEAAIGISNVGMFGVRALTPIIDPDQTFMLGVGAPQATFLPGPSWAPVAVQEVTLSLACDHRAVDGAGAARFLATIVDLIEHPARLLVAHG